MSTEQFIYTEDYVRGRIYSYLKFQKYIYNISEIVCKELGYDKPISASLDPKGDTVWVEFKDSSFGFDSKYLWDKDLKNTLQNYLDQ